MTPLKCPKCGSCDTKIMVQAVVVAPAEMYREFSKQNLRRKDVYLQGVLWETCDFICSACGWASDHYGNYVTRLARENIELKAELLALQRVATDKD